MLPPIRISPPDGSPPRALISCSNLTRGEREVMGIMWPESQSHFHLSFIFIEMNFYSLSFLCAMKSMNICNDQLNYDEIIIQ